MSSSRKRNRWDSDEEDAEEDEKKVSVLADKALSGNNKCPEAQIGDQSQRQQVTDAAVTAVAADQTQRDATSSLPLYNPLLHGCRSVYDCYQRLDAIAEGTYGIVWRAKDLKTDEIVALKQMKDVVTKEGFPVIALREVQVLLDLSHECIVSVREVVVGDDLDKVFMVMPVCYV